MTITINGTTGIAGVDGSAGTPAVQGADTNTGIFFPAADTVGVATGGSERMRIDSSGNVGIGTTSPTTPLDVKVGTGNFTVGLQGAGNAALTASATLNIDAAGASSAMVFKTVGTERMRIDSSGLVGIGMVGSGTVRLSIASSSSFILVGRDSTGTTDQIRVASNGNVTNTNGSYAAISDVKLKENIVDVTPKLADLMQVRVVNYNLKADLGYETHKQIGVVAQELESVFPALIEETTDRDAEGNDLGTTTKNVKYSVFVPMLIKAIQEQQALIQGQQAMLASLTARIEVLEAK